MSDDIFVVEKILDKRRSESGENEFLIKWFGYDEQDASWEPEENVFCKDLILIFERSEDFVVRRERETNSMKKKEQNFSLIFREKFRVRFSKKFSTKSRRNKVSSKSKAPNLRSPMIEERICSTKTETIFKRRRTSISALFSRKKSFR